MEYYDLKSLERIYLSIINEDMFLNRHKIEILKLMLNEIRTYYCYENNGVNCPYASLRKSRLDEKKVIDCKELNKNIYAFLGEEVRMLGCPYKAWEAKIREAINKYQISKYNGDIHKPYILEKGRYEKPFLLKRNKPNLVLIKNDKK